MKLNFDYSRRLLAALGGCSALPVSDSDEPLKDTNLLTWAWVGLLQSYITNFFHF